MAFRVGALRVATAAAAGWVTAPSALARCPSLVAAPLWRARFQQQHQHQLRRAFSTAAPSASNNSAAASGPDAEPVNPEDYARAEAAAGRRSAADDEDDFDANGQGAKEFREEDEDPERTAIKMRILDAALPHVAELGWSHDALRAGAKQLNMSTAAAGIVSRGPAELVELVITRASERMHKHVESLDAAAFAQLSTRARLEIACRARLEGIVPYLSQWPQALALLSQPRNLPTTLRRSAQAVDEIWYLCGDRSTSTDWYSKRALLGAVYAATELFLITDRTTGQQATWAFLRRQLDCARHAAAVPDKLASAGEVFCSIATAAFSRLAPRGQKGYEQQHNEHRHAEHAQYGQEQQHQQQSQPIQQPGEPFAQQQQQQQQQQPPKRDV